LVCLLVLIALSVVAAVWTPARTDDGKIPLVWVTGSNPARLEQIEHFNQEFSRYRLGLDLGDGKAQKVILQCSSGVGPDIFDVYDGDQLQTYAEAGVLWDLTGASKRDGFSAEGDLWPAGKDEVMYEGAQYAYPCNIGANILIYNKNVFDHFGISYPQGLMTWEEFADLGHRVSSAAGGGASVYAVTGLNWQTFFESMGGQFFSEEGKPILADSPELIRAISLYRDFIFKEKLMPSSLELKSMSGQGGWGSGSLNQFAGGRFAMMVTGEWALIGLARTHSQQTKFLEAKGLKPEEIRDPLLRPLRLGCVLIPKFFGSEPSYRVRSRSAAINARSPRREEALAFLKYLAEASYSRLVNQAGDSLPGNPKYSELGLDAGIPDLSRMQMHETTKEAMAHGYVPRRSRYLLTSDVMEILKKQVNRLESDPGLSVEMLLRTAQAEAEKLIARNLERNPELKEKYGGGSNRDQRDLTAKGKTKEEMGKGI